MQLGESVAVGTLTSSTPTVHAVVMLKALTFGGNHPVDQDTLGEFAPPEWLKDDPGNGRSVSPAANRSSSRRSSRS
jgi:hypothetical protein